MQRSHINLILKNNKKNKSGEVPIYLRITIDRKSVFSSTGHYIPEKLWDAKAQLVRKEHLLHEQINLDITQRKKEAMDSVIHSGIKKSAITAKRVKHALGGEQTNIYSFCERLQKDLTGKRKDGTFDNWERHMKKLKGFHESPLYFEQITPTFLTEFETDLRENVNGREGKDIGSYIAAIMRTIRKCFNEAIGQKLISADIYPFKKNAADGGYEIPKQEKGGKEHLNLDELGKLEKFIAETNNTSWKSTAIYFLFGCYTGLRISDWYQFTFDRVHGSYISLQAVKNKSWVAIPIHPRLKKVLQWMKHTPMQEEQRMNEQIKDIAKELKIKKRLSLHCARKTFAVTMCLDMGISSETAAELMGITLKVFVDSYARVTSEKIKKETAVWNKM